MVINFLADVWRDPCGAELDSKQPSSCRDKEIKNTLGAAPTTLLVQHMSARKAADAKRGCRESCTLGISPVSAHFRVVLQAVTSS